MLNKLADNMRSIWLLGAIMAVAVLLNVGAFFLVRNANLDFAEKNAKVMLLTSQEANLAQIKSEYERMGLSQKQVEAGFVAPDKAVDFIVAMENLAQETGNTVSIKAAEDGKSDQGFMAFRLELGGSYSNLVNFLARLESFNYFVAPVKVDVVGGYNEEKKPVLRTNLDIKVLTLWTS